MMKFKRTLSALLAACLMLGVLPTVSLAADTSALHNCNVPEGYHLFTDLPTAEDPVTTETLYWGNAFDGVFYGMNGTFNSSGSTTTSADVAAQSKITIHYGGHDETYGDYYYLVFTLKDGTAYSFAYSSGYFSQNAIQSDGLPSGGWQHKHKLFYDAQEQFFFHRPSNDMTVMKSLKISSSSFKFFTDTVAKVLADGAYPVRVYEVCSSDNVAGTNDTHQWSGSCSCGYKYDYKEVEQEESGSIAGYHLFTDLPTVDNPVTTETLYWGNAFDGVFYGMNGTFSSGSTTTSADVAAQSKITIHYGGNDETYGDYYYLVFTLKGGTAYSFAYSSGYFSQNAIQSDGLPSGGWQHKHKLFYDTEAQLFFHRPSADMTVRKALKISATSFKFFTDTVENVLADGAYPVRVFEPCRYSEWVDVTKPQTLLDKGSQVRTCTVCQYTQTRETSLSVEDFTAANIPPVADVPFYMGATQLQVKNTPTYFFKGVWAPSKYQNMDVTTDMYGATAMYVEEVQDGYKLYFDDNGVKTYLIIANMTVSGTEGVFVQPVTDSQQASVFQWNGQYATFQTNVADKGNYYIGNATDSGTAYTKLQALQVAGLGRNDRHPVKVYMNIEATGHEHSFTAWSMELDNSGVMSRSCACGYVQKMVIPETIPAYEGTSISMHENFGINYYVNMEPIADGSYSDVRVVYELMGKQTTVTEYTQINDCYVFSFDDLAPDLMNETVKATIFATSEDGSEFELSTEYSVAKYCYAALEMEDISDELRTLLVDTLNFGAASQLYRNSQLAAEDLVNANLTDEQRAWGSTGELRALESCRDFSGNHGQVRWYGVAALMGDSVGMRLYFLADDAAGLTVQAESASGKWTIDHIQTKDGMYCVDFEGLNPAQMSEEVSFTVYQGETAVSSTMRYSIESYAAVWFNKADARPEQIELVKALIRYGDAAKAYVDGIYDLQKDVRYLGRTYASGDAQWFNWSASGFSVRFQGSGLTAKIASNAPDAKNYAYLKVYVDGVEQTDILLNKTMQTVVLAEGLNPDEIHTVEVRKRNSPRSSTAGLLSLEVIDGKKVAPEAAKDKLIEFVGDSLTVGYSAADVNKTQTAWSTATEDGTKTYSKQVADALGADYMVTAISGRGVVMNNGGASGYLLPEIYQELDIYNTPGIAYDFALQPDVIVINLGTNDATNSNLDMDAFQTGVYSFIKSVRQKNPNAQIIWAYGLRSDKKTAEVAVAIEAAVSQHNREGDSKVHYLPLELAADMHLNHPTAAAYAPSGEKLIEKIEEITGW